MNSPAPVPRSQTPLPGEWDSAIIRQLAYAGLGLVATIVADLFGLSSTAVLEKGGRIIDALLGFAVIAVPLWLAYRARKNQPTPPIAGTPAVEATIEREQTIAEAPTQAMKIQAMKCSAFAIIGAGMLVVTLLGCVSSNPYRYSVTVLDRAHTTLRLLEESQQVALPLVSSTEVPEAVKASLRAASRSATAAAEQLGKAVIEVEAARAELATASGGDARLRLANARLLEWIQTVKARIAAIKTATKEARAS
jgi:hypothetical protein